MASEIWIKNYGWIYELVSKQGTHTLSKWAAISLTYSSRKWLESHELQLPSSNYLLPDWKKNGHRHEVETALRMTI